MVRNLLLIAGLAFASISAAQNVAPTVAVKLDKKPIVAGSPFTATVVVKFAEGLHGYQNPPTDKFQIPVEVKGADGTLVTKVVYPKGTLKKTAGDTVPSAVYEGEVSFEVTITAPKKPGDAKIKLVFNYQQCTSDNCYPPDKVSVTVPVKVLKK